MGHEENANEREEDKKEEDDSDSSSLEEVEPKLKYERMLNDIQSIITMDSVNCIAFHPKLICVGTRWGIVYLFDHLGNAIHNRHLRAHTVAVNQISMDDRGEFLATCSDDGKVYVYGLYTSDNSQEMSTGRSVKSVAIDPEYHKLGVNRRFIIGDDKLTLHEKTFLSRVKSTVLYEAAGRMQNIRWKGQFVIWTCDEDVRVYDILSMRLFSCIKWRHSEYLPENYPCCLCWKDQTTFLVGWVDMARVCTIEKRNSVIRDDAYVVNAGPQLQVDLFISGIAPLGEDHMVVLGYPKEKDENGKSLRPTICFLQAGSCRYVEVNNERLSLRDYNDYGCHDLHLEYSIDETRFLIACPKDVIVASVYDADDRIDWLVAHDKFEEAMRVISTKSKYLTRNSALTVGKKYLDHLLHNEAYQKAGDLCANILKDKQMWEEEVFKFARKHQLRAVSKHLPRDAHNKLNPHIYEMVLYEYLKIEPEGFLDIVKNWPPDLYNIHAVINAVLEHIVNDSNFRPILLESLAILYTHSKQYDKALAMYLKLRHKDVFQLISRYNLYGSIHEMIEEMMDLDDGQAISLLLEKERVSPDVVVSKLQHNKYYLYLYLDTLDKKDTKGSGKKYHGTLVKLYADFSPQKLLPLLRRSDNYPIQEALAICEENDLYAEMVYLLGRIGNTKEALQLVINKIGDMEQAISFCKEHDDPELWEELIGHSLCRADFITYLLQKIGTYVDPRILVQRIDNKMEIAGLKNSLVKMMQDYNLQVSVKEGCKKIVVSDYYNLHSKLVNLRQRGLRVDDENCCNVCHQKVLIKSSEHKNNVLIFNCHHSFHEECLPTANEKCVICYSEKPPSISL